jgi:hypothetical protein
MAAKATPNAATEPGADRALVITRLFALSDHLLTQRPAVAS